MQTFIFLAAVVLAMVGWYAAFSIARERSFERNDFLRDLAKRDRQIDALTEQHDDEVEAHTSQITAAHDAAYAKGYNAQLKEFQTYLLQESGDVKRWTQPIMAHELIKQMDGGKDYLEFMKAKATADFVRHLADEGYGLRTSIDMLVQTIDFSNESQLVLTAGVVHLIAPPLDWSRHPHFATMVNDLMPDLTYQRFLGARETKV